MKIYELDLSNIADRDSLHVYLKETLSLPEYSQPNLDSLSDCLGDLTRDTMIVLRGADIFTEKLGKYGEKTLKVFDNTSSEA